MGCGSSVPVAPTNAPTKLDSPRATENIEISFGSHCLKVDHTQSALPVEIKDFIVNNYQSLSSGTTPIKMAKLPQFWPLADMGDTEWGPKPAREDEGGYRNWAGNQMYTCSRYKKPKNKAELKICLQEAVKDKLTVRVSGGSYASSSLLATSGLLIDTGGLREILFDKEAKTCTLECGVMLIDAIAYAANSNLMFPVTPIFAKMSIGGAVAVAAHGTGKHTTHVSDALVEVEVLAVNEHGEVYERVFSINNPADKKYMSALKVNLGCLGVVYKCKFQLQDMFLLHCEDRIEPWPEDMEAYLTDFITNNDYAEFFWWPTTPKIWTKRWNKIPIGKVTPKPERNLDFILMYSQSTLSRLLLGLLSLQPSWTPELLALCLSGTITSSTIIPAQEAYNFLVPVPPKHWDLNMGIPINKDESGKVDFSKAAKALTKVHKMTGLEAQSGRYPLNASLHARFVQASSCYLSSTSKSNYLTAQIEIVTFNITPNWLYFFKQVEEELTNLGGLPHWGKLILKTPPKDSWAGADKFLKIRSKMDPLNIFRNDFIYDVFERKLPKLVTIKPISADVREVDLLWLLGVRKKLFGVKIETAVDSDEVTPTDKMEWHDDLGPVVVTNFAQIQLYSDDSVIGTAVLHFGLMNDLALGGTKVCKLDLRRNWAVNSKQPAVGTITVEVTPINFSFPPNFEESISVFTDDEFGSNLATQFAEVGLKVYLTQLGSFEPSLHHNIIISSVEDAIEKSPILVFCTDVAKIGELAKQISPYKVVIDAVCVEFDHIHDPEGHFENYHDAYVVKAFGTMRKVIPAKGGKIQIAGDDLSTKELVSSLVQRMGYIAEDKGRLHKAHYMKYTDHYTKLDQVLNPNAIVIPVLPQHDSDPKDRTQALEAVRKKYKYNTTYFKSCNVPGEWPAYTDWKFNMPYLGDMFSGLFKGIIRYGIWEGVTMQQRDALSGYTAMNDLAQRAFESTKDIWCPDVAFGECRLGGVDPRSLYRVPSKDEIPSNFPVQDSHLQVVVPGATLQDEASKGNLFIVNYSVLKKVLALKKDTKDFLASPIALFVWHGLKLLPVCIQLDQDPSIFPVCGPNSGLVWQAAKIFFQVAAAHVHTLGAHEYSQHVTIGAISMATPRQLSSVHPIFVLLEPHLHLTPFHTSYQGSNLRIQSLSPIFTLQPEDSKILVALYGEDVNLYQAAFNENLKLRKMEEHPPKGYYPYRDDGLLMWQATHKFVTEYLSIFYADERMVTKDSELKNWITELSDPQFGALRGVLPPGKSVETLALADIIQLVTTIIWIAGPHHAATHFPQGDYDSDPFHISPGKTRKGPLPGEVNFEYFKKMLPSREIAIHQAVTFAGGNLHYDQFGDYKKFRLARVNFGSYVDDKTKSNIAPLLEKFDSELANIENQIIAADTARYLQFPYFRRSLCPNSTNV